MTKLSRYIIVAVFATIGCLMWYLSSRLYILRILGNLLIVISVFILNPNQLKQPIHFALPKWNAKEFFKTLTILLISILVVIVMNALPDYGASMFGKWYFVVTIWLIMLSALSRRWFEEKEEIAGGKGTYSESERNKEM